LDLNEKELAILTTKLITYGLISFLSFSFVTFRSLNGVDIEELPSLIFQLLIFSLKVAISS
jgi:hypothetical protein